MDILVSSYRSGTLAHAYLVSGPRTHTLEGIQSFLESEVGVSLRGNPDVWHEEFEVLSVDDSRRIKDAQTGKAFGDKGRFFILSIVSATIEAQNALLKTFEEPRAGIFFVLVENPDILIPTLRSRFFALSWDKEEVGNEDLHREAVKFLKAARAKRINILGKIVKNKDKAAANMLLGSLEKATRDVYKDKAQYAYALDAIYASARQVATRGGSLKIALENLALQLPKV